MNLKRLISLGFVNRGDQNGEMHPDDTDHRTNKNTYNLKVRNPKNKKVDINVEQNPGTGNWVIDIIPYDFMEGIDSVKDVMEYVEMVKSGELDQEECAETLWSLTEKGRKEARNQH